MCRRSIRRRRRDATKKSQPNSLRLSVSFLILSLRACLLHSSALSLQTWQSRRAGALCVISTHKISIVLITYKPRDVNCPLVDPFFWSVGRGKLNFCVGRKAGQGKEGSVWQTANLSRWDFGDHRLFEVYEIGFIIVFATPCEIELWSKRLLSIYVIIYIAALQIAIWWKWNTYELNKFRIHFPQSTQFWVSKSQSFTTPQLIKYQQPTFLLLCQTNPAAFSIQLKDKLQLRNARCRHGWRYILRKPGFPYFTTLETQTKLN